LKIKIRGDIRLVLNNKLLELRKKKGLSQLELAEQVGVSRQAISRWEVGSAIPSTENLVFLSRLYGVSVDYLLNDDETKENASCPTRETEEKNTAGQKRSFVWLILAIVILIVVFVVIGIAKWRSEESVPSGVPMSEIEGSEIQTDSEQYFDIEW